MSSTAGVWSKLQMRMPNIGGELWVNIFDCTCMISAHDILVLSVVHMVINQEFIISPNFAAVPEPYVDLLILGIK